MVTRSTRSRTRSPLVAEVLRPYRGRLAALAVVLTLASTAPLAGPHLLRAFIDNAIAGERLSLLLVIATAYVALGLVVQLTTVATSYAAANLAWSATNALRERVADHVLHLDLEFHATTSPGTLVERVDGDTTAMATLFTDVVVKVTGGVLTLVGAVVLVTMEDWRVGVAFGVFVAAVAAVIVRLRDRAVPATITERAAYADVIGTVEESLDAGDDLRSLDAGGFAVDRHARHSDRHVTSLVRAWKSAGWLESVATGAFAFGGIGMLAAGWYLHATGVVSVGTVFLLLNYVQVLRRPLEDISEQLEEVTQAGAGAGRLGALLKVSSTLTAGGRSRLPEGALDVTVEDVTFAYPDDDKPVLSDVALHVPAGSAVGLVGHSGSGKTTLARLALRLVDPTEGRVLVGGVDLREVDPQVLRHRVAVVTQDVQVFDATLRDNLTLFDSEPDHDDAELVGLIADLGLGDWYARLPDGLDTVLGDGGAASLSAGQAQLLGVGRAFLRDPGLVVLDEASSRVDPTTARLVEAALDRLLAGRTAIVIAHRLRAVDRADRVVVLDGGRIVEHGRRVDLVSDPTSRFHHLLQLEHEGATR